MNFKFQKNVAIVLSSVIIGTTALSGVNVYADEITATEEDVSLNDDIFNENDIIYGISTQSSDAETTLTKSEMSAFAQAFNDSLKEDNINVSNGYGRGDNYRRNSACITKSRNSKNICWNRSKINCICFVLGRWNELKNKKNNRYLIIGIGYLILFFIVLTPDINNAVGRGIQALLFCVLGYRCEENIRRFIKNR